MKASGQFTTSRGTIIPSGTMSRVAEALDAGEDWQAVATNHLRHLMPEHDDDLAEANEVLSEAELRNHIQRVEFA